MFLIFVKEKCRVYYLVNCDIKKDRQILCVFVSEERKIERSCVCARVKLCLCVKERDCVCVGKRKK